MTTLPISLHAISRDEAPTLRNFFELYAYDFSEIVPLELHANGRFDISVPDLWWDDAQHFPFFIRENERLCGFALARRGSRHRSHGQQPATREAAGSGRRPRRRGMLKAFDIARAGDSRGFAMAKPFGNS